MQEPIRASGLRVGSVMVANELHLTGGQRAVMAGDRLWSLFPVLDGRQVCQLSPASIRHIAEIAAGIGGTLFGGDEASGMGTPLIARIWTPLDGPGSGQLQPADKWRAICHNAEAANDRSYAEIAGHIAFSLTAAGIRLRDASDQHHGQLMAALVDRRVPGRRFTNIPVSDLQLAFHSVVSELASARDYLAKALALALDAPAGIDALSRLDKWLSAPSRAHLRDTPILSEMLSAYDHNSPDPWLYRLSVYRNQFLHRQPMGRGERGWLRYEERKHEGITIPVITMPLNSDDPFAPGADALLTFVGLYRRMTALLDQAANAARYAFDLPQVVLD